MAVGALPEPYRGLILRLFWEEATEAEAAALTGMSQSGVSRRKAAALRLLRQRL